jgi:hypothetical protein
MSSAVRIFLTMVTAMALAACASNQPHISVAPKPGIEQNNGLLQNGIMPQNWGETS